MNVMEHNRPSGRTRRRFTKEFKADAVALVLDGDRPGGPCGPGSGDRGDEPGQLGSPGPHRPRREAGIDHRGARRAGPAAEALRRAGGWSVSCSNERRPSG